MKLLLKRTALKDNYTIGKLYVDGRYLCDTLEDSVRNTRIYGETAIPYGKYPVTLKIQSPRFAKSKQYARCKGYLPRLLKVPNYSGILIHIGNTPDDTEGCILVGENKEKGKVINSEKTFWRLYEILSQTSEPITIEIK